MSKWPQIVEEFPLSAAQVFRYYMRIPEDTSGIFYHYTTNAGVEGILRTGGLRATYRMRMNDPGEFEYARNLIFETLNLIASRQDFPPVVQSLITYTRKNLGQFLKDSSEMATAYCACVSVASDHPKLWEAYAESGRGFALGINLLKFLANQRHAGGSKKPFVFCAPVAYKEAEQRRLVLRLVETGLRDIQAFSNECSQRPDDLAAIRDRITQEIVIQLLSLIDFIKAPIFSSEQEFRLILDPNDGTLMARDVQHYQSGEQIMPFVFIDFRDHDTKRLPLVEIKVGPGTSFNEKEPFLKELLDDLGYGSIHRDRPAITQSLATIGGH